MTNNKKYYAFISYSHKDEEWAKWLQHEFEHYHLPTTLNGLPNLPDSFRPIFRDVDELSGGELKPQISAALHASANLIVICSTNSVKSKYVNEEILEFIEIGKRKGLNNISNIFPFIIDGIPNSKEKPDDECFPEALRNLSSDIIAGDVTKNGREHAFVKILSGTLQHTNISFNMLWDRFEKDRIEKERRKREEQNKLLKLQSRYLADKMQELTEKGNSYLACMLGLIALPSDLKDSDDRPYCPEAEAALRAAYSENTFIFDKISAHSVVSPDCELIATVHKSRIYVVRTCDGAVANVFTPLGGLIRLKFGNDSRYLITSSDEGLYMFDIKQDMTIVTFGHARSPFELSHNCKFIAYQYDSGQYGRLASAYSTVHDIIVLKIDKTQHFPIPRAHRKEITSISFSRNDEYLLSSSKDKTIKIWDIKNRECVRHFKGHTSTVKIALFCPNEKYVLSLSETGELNLWDIRLGTLIKSIMIPGDGCFDMYYSDNKQKIVVVSGNYRGTIFNFETLEILEGQPDSFSFRDCSLYLDNKGIDGLHVKLNRPSVDLISETKYIGIYKSASFTHDGKHVIYLSDNKIVQLWQPLSNISSMLEIGKPYCASLVESSKDGRYLVIVSPYNTIIVWDAIKKTIYQEFREKIKVNSISISPDSADLLVGLSDGTIHIWDLMTCSLKYEKRAEGYDYCYHVVYNLNGSGLVVNSSGCYLIDTKTAIETYLSKVGSVKLAKISPDGETLVTITDGALILQKELHIFNIANNQIVHTITEDDDIYSLDFSNDNRYLLYSVGHDKYKVIDVDTSQTILTRKLPQINDITNSIKKVEFSPSGREILVALRYGDLFLHNFPPLQEIIDQVKERFKNRTLTSDEKAMFYIE